MTDRLPPTVSLATFRRRAQPHDSSGGFTLLEMMIVVAVALIILKISLPIYNMTMGNLHLGASASSLAAGIQTARFQAISTGCPIQLNASATPVKGMQAFQLTTEPSCSCSTTVTGTAIPYSTADISIASTSPSANLYLNPSGMVSPVPSACPPTTAAVPTVFTITLSQLNGSKTKTVNVSGAGYVTITAP